MTPEHQAAETALRVALAKIERAERDARFWMAMAALFWVGLAVIALVEWLA